MFPRLIAALLVSKMPNTSKSASTVVILTLAGLEGRITSLTFRGRFFLFGVGTCFVLSLPGYLKESLATGVFKATWGWSFRLFARVFRAFSTLGTARAAMFAAAFTSLSIAPCLGQTETSWAGCLTFSPQTWQICEVFAEFTERPNRRSASRSG